MSYKIFIYTALACEAKPLVEYFQLKKDLNVQPFAVYGRSDVCLTVTGLGKSAMAAGAAYSQALFAKTEHPVLINIGVAGHRDYQIGDLYLADKITDAESHKSYYPPLITKALCPSNGIITRSIPQLAYDHAELCDMEASAFYETAIRFTPSELVQCLKIISDNQQQPASNLQAKQVSSLIAPHLATLAAVIKQTEALANMLVAPELPLLTELTQRYHFTASHRLQLTTLLGRWAVLTDNQPLNMDDITFSHSKDLLRWLEQQVSQVAIFL